MALLFGIYDTLRSNGLYQPSTGQRLTLSSDRGEMLIFKYRDKEIDHDLHVQLQGSRFIYGIIDLNCVEYLSFQENYGVWRRIVWFALDAMTAWLKLRRPNMITLRIWGGWRDGRWCPKSSLLLTDLGLCSPPYRCSTTRLPQPLADFTIYPLRAAPVQWRFESPESPIREGGIASYADDLELPIINLSNPVSVQLAQVPRFVADDNAVIYHCKVLAHKDHARHPLYRYGVVLKDCAFTFDGTEGPRQFGDFMRMPSTPVATPITVNTELLMANSISVIKSLHPRLREELFFMISELSKFRRGRSKAYLPQMQAFDSDSPLQTLQFGRFLSRMLDAPSAIGFWHCHVVATDET